MVTPLVNELEEEAERLRTEVAILQAKLEEERSSEEPASDFVTEAMPPDVVVADLNGDGWLDMYCREGAADMLYVNLGNGSFSATQIEN